MNVHSTLNVPQHGKVNCTYWQYNHRCIF